MMATTNGHLEGQSQISDGAGRTIHLEEHSVNGAVIRDIIIGFADGLTVPFALTAGLSS
jgi:hypothetical protein